MDDPCDQPRPANWLQRIVPTLLQASVVVTASMAVHAQSASNSDLPSWVSGSARGSYWTGSRNLDDTHDLPGASLWLKAEPRFSGVAATLEGWIREEDFSSSGHSRSRLREAYVETSLGETSVRLGRQIVVWGRADQLNPTDNLTPRDLTLDVPDTGDDRFGTLAASASRRIGSYTASAMWLPRFRPNKVPYPPGLTVSASPLPGAGQAAFKFDHAGSGGIDWSVSWFSGFDLNPTLQPNPSAPGGMLETHPRIRVAGADFAVPVGRIGFRGEVAYTWTDGAAGIDATRKHPFFFGVFGIERTFLESLNVNLQAYAYAVRGYQDPRSITDPALRELAISQAILNHQLNRHEYGLALRIADKWWNDTLEAEVAILSSLERRDFAIKPKVTYAFTDHVKGTLGAELLRGSRDAFFRRFQTNSVAYAELRYSW